MLGFTMNKYFIYCILAVFSFELSEGKGPYYDDCDCVIRYKELNKKTRLTRAETEEMKDLEQCPCVIESRKDNIDEEEEEPRKRLKSRKDSEKEDDIEDEDRSTRKPRKTKKSSSEKYYEEDEEEVEEEEKPRKKLKPRSDSSQKKNEEEEEDRSVRKTGRTKKNLRREDDVEQEKDSRSSTRSRSQQRAALEMEYLKNFIKTTSYNNVFLLVDNEKQSKSDNNLSLKKYRINKKTSKKLAKELENYRKIYS